MNNINIIKILEKICGDDGVIKDLAEVQIYDQDWDKKFNNRSICVVLPRNKNEVSQIVKFCNDNLIKIIPQGGNTGLVAGANPTATNQEIILNLKKMNKIKELDKFNLSIELEAGVILEKLKEKCERENLYFPLEITSSGSSQIGGNIASNAGGMNAIKFGSMRDQLLGLEVITADGSIINVNNKMRKNNMGYDLKHLFCGSEGTLGIITAATLKLYPLPKKTVSILLAYNNISSLLKSYLEIRNEFSDLIESCEFFTNISFEIVKKNSSISKKFFSQAYHYYLLIRLTSSSFYINLEHIVTSFLDKRKNYADVIIPTNKTQEKEFWNFREMLSESQKKEGYVIHNDISVPINELETLFDDVRKKISNIDKKCILHSFGHLGDSNIHMNIIFDSKKKDLNNFEYMVTEIINEKVIDLGGSISAEHGIGVIKKISFLKYTNNINIEIMKKIKKLLDPNNIMNPNKIFDA